ncbi:MAG: LysM peptidoglycan-binding domain-containing protein [Desulfobacteraceae bacterium]|nr:LysM peptidoglycan-binding domain-containing protein [Desulfobacteraceae bacterium]
MNFLFKYIPWVCLLSLLFPFGCVPQKKAPPIEKQQQVAPSPVEKKKIETIKQTYYIHIVEWDGESLSLISRWYIGNYKDWKLLARHNPELNPSNIHVGDRVWIPKEKMKTSKQMPKTFLNKYYKKTTQPNSKKPEEIEKKPIELYGPKEHKEKTEEYNYDQ